LFLGLVRYRSMTLQTVAKATFDTIETTASVLFIVTAASIFAWLLTVSQAAQILTDTMLGITHNKWVFLLLGNILILFVGCFIDTLAAVTILVPILLPSVLKLGTGSIHFGLMMTPNLLIGLLAPQLGMVRIRFGAGGICGSDMHYYRHARTGDFVVTSPLVLGHEIAGEVIEIAGAAPGLKTGDRVAVNPSRWCGHCTPCREGRLNLCE